MTLTYTGSEWNLLLSLCQMAISPSKQLPTIDWKDVDWEKLLQLAGRHQIRPLLYRGAIHYKDFIPIEVVQVLRNDSTRATTRNLHNTKGILQLAEILNDLNWLPFKGVLLSKLAYQNLSTRQSSDIDILIHKKDFYIVKNRLLKAGFVCQELPPTIEKKLLKYNCEHKFEYFVDGRQIYNIDVHWQIGNRALQLDFNLMDFQQLANPADFHGTVIQQLTPEGLLFNTCLHHGGKEYWRSLKFIFDLYAITSQYKEQIDWDFFFQLTTQKSTNKIILIGLNIMSNLLNYQLPAPVISQIELLSLDQEQTYDYTLPIYQPIPSKGTPHSLLKLLKYHLSVRTSATIKAKILFYHILLILTPNANDVDNAHQLSTVQYILLVFNKPIRLFNKHLKVSEATSD